MNACGNENADQLAKLASSRPDIKVALLKVWQNRWDSVGINKMHEITTCSTLDF